MNREPHPATVLLLSSAVILATIALGGALTLIEWLMGGWPA